MRGQGLVFRGSLSGAIVGIVLVTLYLISRSGLGAPVVPVAVCLGLAFFLIFAPDLLVSGDEPARPLLKALALAIVFVTGFAPGVLVVAAGFLLSAIGYVGLAIAIRRGRFFVGGLEANSAWIFFSLLFGAAFAGIIWGTGTLSPLFLEKIAVGSVLPYRYAATDSLFHVAITQMFLNYGVPSTGLDGVPLVGYHFGSHLLMASLSRLIGVAPLTTYNLGYPVVLVPFFVKCAIDLAATQRAVAPSSEPHIGADGVSMMVLASILLPVLPFDFISPFGAGFRIDSESFTLAVALGWIYIEWLIGKVRAQMARDDQSPRPVSLDMMVASPLMLAAITLTKISVGYGLSTIAAFLFLRLGLHRKPWGWVPMATHLLAIAVCHLAQRKGNYPLSLAFLPNFFPLPRRYHLLVIFTTYFWAWAFVVHRLWRFAPGGWVGLRLAFAERRVLEVEAVVGFVLFTIPLLLFVPLLTNEAYVTNSGFWLLLPVVAGAAGHAYTYRHSMQHQLARVGLPVTFTLAIVAIWHYLPMGREIRDFRSLRTIASLDSGMNAALLDALRRLEASVPPEEKNATAAFVPKSNRRFWDAFALCERPFWSPTVQFLVPAVTGLAMVYGLPERNCWPLNYGFRDYDFDTGVGNVSTSVTEACVRARAKGFARLVILDVEANSGDFTIEHQNCGGET